MENAASILLRASQHPEKHWQHTIEGFSASRRTYENTAIQWRVLCEDYNWQDICLCNQFWIVINAPECLSPWLLRVPEYIMYLNVADTLFQPYSQLLIFITRFVESSL